MKYLSENIEKCAQVGTFKYFAVTLGRANIVWLKDKFPTWGVTFCSYEFWGNGLLLFSVCNAGHYRNNGTCVMVTGNYVKKYPGDVSNLQTAPSHVVSECDGITEVPNDNHTACGKLDYKKWFYSKQNNFVCIFIETLKHVTAGHIK